MKSVAASKPEHVAIQRVIASIPRGRVSSYGEIAQRAGLPGRARLVGRVLGESGVERLPWHRVLRSSGQSAFPQGSREFREQSQRLRMEGVVVVNGRVNLQIYGWQRDLDVELWGPPPASPKKSAPKKSRAPAKPARDAKPVARRR
jgi:methylated-DNA-protein-cysteine methyltransferase-like protein